MDVFTYADVGATRCDTDLPDGYHHVRLREHVGHGKAAFEAVAEGVMTWKVHRGAGLNVSTTSGRADVGVDVTTGIGAGPLQIPAPCRVVWTIDEPGKRGFAYGTRRGHPASGEEAFTVEIDDAGDVWFDLLAFSRAAAWYAKLGGPLTRAVQQIAVRRYAAAARQLAA